MVSYHHCPYSKVAPDIAGLQRGQEAMLIHEQPGVISRGDCDAFIMQDFSKVIREGNLHQQYLPILNRT